MRGYSSQTVRSYSIALKALLKHHEIEQRGGVTYINIMPLRLAMANLSKKTISARLSAIRSFIEYLNSYQNQKLKLQGDQSVKVPKSLPKPIEDKNIKEVIERCSLEERVIITMLYALGLRISELASLKVLDISESWVRVFGKGAKVREVPLLRSVASLIFEYKKLKKPIIYLFEKDGKAITASQLRYRVQKAFKRQGIKATPHQLRHAFATELLKDGARIADVSELLGHSSMATTQVYTKLTSATKLQNYLKAHPLSRIMH